jgi:hypothetical protein
VRKEREGKEGMRREGKGKGKGENYKRIPDKFGE